MSPSIRVSALILLLSGCVVNVFAYSSVQPLFASALFFLSAATLLRFTNLGGAYEQRMFNTVFGVGWLMSSVAAMYANFLHDSFQTANDPAWFFELASRGAGPSLHSLESISEGAGAIVLWRWVYDALAAVGFAREPYIGILVNVTAVAVAGVLGVKMARLIYGEDPPRLNLLIRLFSWCGLLWLFAAIHLRDSVILLSVTTLAYMWVRYLESPALANLTLLGVATAMGAGLIAILRTDFLFVPLAMLFAGLVVSLVYEKSRGTRKLVAYSAAFAGVIIAGALYARYHEEISNLLGGGYKLYMEMARQGASSSSLGMSLIVNQPLPTRLVLGSAFLYVQPIPFWGGLRGNSAYELFKSFNALFFYGLIPLLALAVAQIVRTKAVRTAPVMFLLFVVLGFTAAVAGTSGETRHFGAFLVPLFVLVLLPDLSVKETRKAYKMLLYAFLGLMFAVHLAWFGLKL